MSKKDYELVHKHIEEIIPKLKMKATSLMPFPYLRPSCPSGETYFDSTCLWDAFFEAVRLTFAGEYEHFKNLVDLFLYFQNPISGWISNTVCPEPNKNSVLLYPETGGTGRSFLAQAAYLYVSSSEDKEWGKKQFERLRKYVEYRKIYEYNPCMAIGKPQGMPFGLYVGSHGGDNDVTKAFYPRQQVIGVALNSFMYMELISMGKLAGLLQMNKERKRFEEEAKVLKEAINKYLWDEENKFYFNILLVNGAPILWRSWGGLTPLYTKIAPEERAGQIIEKFVMNEKYFLSPYGIRSLSKDCPYYNNAVLGNPPRDLASNYPGVMTGSNWQGPIWVIVNYLTICGLINYGYEEKATVIADRLLATLATVIEKDGMMYENYSAETGEGLWAPGFGSWNILADIMHLICEKATASRPNLDN